MSWIKKLFQTFKSEEDETQKYMEQTQTEWEFEENSQKEISKDVNAKVVYQYPKGQFRFPLIPDEENETRRREPRNRQEEKRVQTSTVQEKRVAEREKISNSNRSGRDTNQKRNESEVAIAKSRRPFRPTEIPSPIYGFDRPKIKVKAQQANSAPIEYELELHDLLDESQIDVQQEGQSLHAATLEVSEKNVQNVFTENWSSSDETEESVVIEIESIHQSSLNDELGIRTEIEVLNMEPEKDFETEKVAMAPVNSEIDFHNEAIFSEPEPHESIEEQNQEIQNTEVIEETETLETSSSRKHIPFNVIMLNQDKKKLVQRPATPKPINVRSERTTEAMEIEPSSHWDEEKTEDAAISYYEFPSRNLLKPAVKQEETSEWLYEQEQLLNSTLKNFNVGAKVVNVTQGPAVTRYEVQPEPGVKVNKITNLSDDIKLSLAARDIRIEAPIPGKHTIGIEVPNRTSRTVFISEIINSPEFLNSSSPLTAVLGLDIAGKPIVTDLRKMPHGLIAGATGSGKSVCINTILISLLYKATPDELKLILIDPKMVELAPYNRIPHLVSPVITDVKAATAALKWAVEEMERRYELFAHTGVRDISRFNELAEEHKQYSDKLPYMVIIIDELADLMMMSPADVEEAICRIAQKARACGIHLIIATQRPSVDVITGLIKANVPTRIAFSVSSQIDSRTIIDISGAEKLLGRGDMLFLENGSSKPVRLQGTFVSDNEIDDVVAHVRKERAPEYLFEQEELLKKAQVIEEEDELFYEACEFVVEQGSASTSSLQRRFKIGYNRAARLIDMMEQQGFISETRGSKAREVHITEAELVTLQDTSTIN